MTTDALTTPVGSAPTAGGPAGRARPRRRTQRAAYAFLLPWSIGVAVLTIGPMLISLYLSFTDYDLFDTPHWIGVRNYVRMFTDDDHYWHAVTATLEYVVISVPVKLCVALGIALLLNRIHRASGFYRSACYAPSLLGASVSVALVWRAMFGSGGTIERVLGVFGIHVGSMIDQPKYALLTVIALGVWQFGAPMVIFLAGLKQVPRELYEAAAIDGAGPARRFASITLPALSPVLLFNLVLEIIHAFQAFTSAFVISNGRGGPSDSTLLYTLYLYQRGFNDFQMGYASALAWVLLAVIAIITVLLFRGANRWVFYAGEAGR
jgi:multiple sugar transport system permease protein